MDPCCIPYIKRNGTADPDTKDGPNLSDYLRQQIGRCHDLMAVVREKDNCQLVGTVGNWNCDRTGYTNDHR
jgi:hypothetical protein